LGDCLSDSSFSGMLHLILVLGVRPYVIGILFYEFLFPSLHLCFCISFLYLKFRNYFLSFRFQELIFVSIIGVTLALVGTIVMIEI